MIVSPRYQLVDAIRHVSCVETTIEALSRATAATIYSLLSAKTHLARRETTFWLRCSPPARGDGSLRRYATGVVSGVYLSVSTASLEGPSDRRPERSVTDRVAASFTVS